MKNYSKTPRHEVVDALIRATCKHKVRLPNSCSQCDDMVFTQCTQIMHDDRLTEAFKYDHEIEAYDTGFVNGDEYGYERARREYGNPWRRQQMVGARAEDRR